MTGWIHDLLWIIGHNFLVVSSLQYQEAPVFFISMFRLTLCSLKYPCKVFETLEKIRILMDSLQKMIRMVEMYF